MSFKPENFTIWTEIPVTDLDRSMAFYGKVFQTELTREDMDGHILAMFPTANQGGIAGHLYPGKPAAAGTGPTIHLVCPDKLEASMDRLTEAGGTVISDPITIPPGRFAYCQDLDGNSIGLFEKA